MKAISIPHVIHSERVDILVKKYMITVWNIRGERRWKLLLQAC